MGHQPSDIERGASDVSFGRVVSAWRFGRGTSNIGHRTWSVGRVFRTCLSDVSFGRVFRMCLSDVSFGRVFRTCLSDVTFGRVVSDV